MWIEQADGIQPEIGDVVFIAYRHCNGRDLGERMSDRPFTANLSGQERLFGWCGSTNNVSTTAAGLAVVTGKAGPGHYWRVRRITAGSAAEHDALAALGWTLEDGTSDRLERA